MKISQNKNIIFLLLVLNCIVVLGLNYIVGRDLIYPDYDMSENFVKLKSNRNNSNKKNDFDFLLEYDDIKVIAETNRNGLIGLYNPTMDYYYKSTKFNALGRLRYFSMDDYREKKKVAININEISPNFRHTKETSFFDIPEVKGMEYINTFDPNSTIYKDGLRVIVNLFALSSTSFDTIYIDSDNVKHLEEINADFKRSIERYQEKELFISEALTEAKRIAKNILADSEVQAEEMVRLTKEDLAERVRNTEEKFRRLEEAKRVAEEALTVLHEVRQKNAKEIATALHQELVDLGMPKGDIQFHIEEGTELSSLGAKSIEMLFSANKGEQLLPLHKVASGGELARIALAFKSVFRSDAFKTMVFDEIDVGISGDIALKVAEKILNLSRTNQVFCITHLPQTASIAKQHYHLSKIEQDDRTISTLVVLNEEERVTQIASMMSGKGMSDTALAAAKELIDHFN